MPTSNLQDIWRFDLRQGSSSSPATGACLYDAISWFEYGELGDHPACSCDVIAAYGRGMNDILPDAERQRLKAYIPRLIGNVDPEARLARAEYLAWRSIRVFAPLALDAAGFPDAAERLRNFKGTLREAAGNARVAGDSEASNIVTSYAAEASYAAADAAFGAATLNDYVDVALRTSHAASYASAITPQKVYAAMFETLDGVIAIGKQAPAIELSRFEEASDLFARARERV